MPIRMRGVEPDVHREMEMGTRRDARNKGPKADGCMGAFGFA